MNGEYKARMKASGEYIKKLLVAIGKCLKSPLCGEQQLNLMHMQLKMEVAARQKAKKYKADRMKVYNVYGENTNIIATASLKNMRDRDFAIITGDFRKFNVLTISSDYNIEAGDKLVACGYAGGRTPPICLNLTYISNYMFMRYAHGLLIRGMSGGPVLNKHGLVVGINSAVVKNGVIFDSIIGVFNRKFEKPIIKKEVKREREWGIRGFK